RVGLRDRWHASSPEPHAPRGSPPSSSLRISRAFALSRETAEAMCGSSRLPAERKPTRGARAAQRCSASRTRPGPEPGLRRASLALGPIASTHGRTRARQEPHAPAASFGRRPDEAGGRTLVVAPWAGAEGRAGRSTAAPHRLVVVARTTTDRHGE